MASRKSQAGHKISNTDSDKQSKFLISTLRTKVLELQNKNKLLEKLLKKYKNTNDAYRTVKSLASARKVLAKLQIQNDNYKKELENLRKEIHQRNVKLSFFFVFCFCFF